MLFHGSKKTKKKVSSGYAFVVSRCGKGSQLNNSQSHKDEGSKKSKKFSTKNKKIQTLKNLPENMNNSIIILQELYATPP